MQHSSYGEKKTTNDRPVRSSNNIENASNQQLWTCTRIGGRVTREFWNILTYILYSASTRLLIVNFIMSSQNGTIPVGR